MSAIDHRHGERVKTFRKDDAAIPADPQDNASHHTAKVTKYTVESFGFNVVPHPLFFLKPAPPPGLENE